MGQVSLAEKTFPSSLLPSPWKQNKRWDSCGPSTYSHLAVSLLWDVMAINSIWASLIHIFPFSPLSLIIISAFASMASCGQIHLGSQCVPPSTQEGCIHTCTCIENTDKTGHLSQSHSIGPMSLHSSQWSEFIQKHSLCTSERSYSADTVTKAATLCDTHWTEFTLYNPSECYLICEEAEGQSAEGRVDDSRSRRGALKKT